VHKKLLYLGSSGILRGYLPKEDSTFLPDLQRIPYERKAFSAKKRPKGEPFERLL